MLIERALKSELKETLAKTSKIVLIFGPRQAGKTTLVKEVLASLPGKKLEINADELRYVDTLSSRNLDRLKQLVSGYDLLFLDEAQRVPEIGINLKLLHDHLPELRIIATGSSSLDLASKVREPLTGRTRTYQLMPLAISELAHHFNRYELNAKLEDLLLFGGYPEVFSLESKQDKMEYLREMTLSYLFKDILEVGAIKYTPKLRDLVRMLAYQVGSEVSINELCKSLQLHRDIVNNYLDLLEKSFVIIRLGGYHRNLRKEITRHNKIYFCDLGIRNAIIENFNPLDRRDDGGKLWENFLITERMKTQSYRRIASNYYFWRTYGHAEIDFIEEKEGKLFGYEFKFSSKLAKAPSSWGETYPESSFEVVNRDNYLDFLL
jgi:predicted AAA+ superfamily ATPase